MLRYMSKNQIPMQSSIMDLPGFDEYLRNFSLFTNLLVKKT